MIIQAFKRRLVVLLMLASLAPSAYAQAGPGLGDQLHANALASFRQARFSEAYGRFIGLADAGHAPSAAIALWMYQNGPTVFGKYWDSSPDQLTAWARLAGQPAPTMTARSSPQPAALASKLAR